MALTMKQQKCIEMMVHDGLTQKEIANELGVSENTITNWKKKESFGEEYDLAVRKYINSMSAEATRTMHSLLSAKNENVRYSAAKDILDRSGFKAEEKLNLMGNIEFIDDLDMRK